VGGAETAGAANEFKTLKKKQLSMDKAKQGPQEKISQQATRP